MQLKLFDNIESKKEYRCVRKPTSPTDFGKWEVKYKGTWHNVINCMILYKLNNEARFYKQNNTQ